MVATPFLRKLWPFHPTLRLSLVCNIDITWKRNHVILILHDQLVYDPASCGCGFSRKDRSSNCSECWKEQNESRDCVTEGCGKKRHGRKQHCKHCRNLSGKHPMTCFLCGGETTRDVSTKKTKNKKAGIWECIRKDNMGCFRRCNAYKGGVRGGEGGNDGRCQRDCFMDKKNKNTRVKHATSSAA